MVQYSELRTTTLRTMFAGVYAANFIVAAMHIGKAYLDVVASITIMVASAFMLCITMQQPEKLMVYLEMSGKEIVFTWCTRMIADIVQIVFLISCGPVGEILAIVTGVMLFLAFTLAQKRPDIFRELFRKHASDPLVGDENEDVPAADGTSTEASSGYDNVTEPSATAV